jgi:hypothetical protein
MNSPRGRFAGAGSTCLQKHMSNPSSPASVPDWAITHVRGALGIGKSATEIEQWLVAQGLAPAAAKSTVISALEEGVQREFESIHRTERRDRIHRMLSGGVACVSVLTAYWLGGIWFALRALVGILLPLACIWFPDGMGTHWSAFSFNRPTIGPMVRLGGWVLLLSLAIFLAVLVEAVIGVQQDHAR